MKGFYIYPKPNPAFERALKRFRKEHKEFYK